MEELEKLAPSDSGTKSLVAQVLSNHRAPPPLAPLNVIRNVEVQQGQTDQEIRTLQRALNLAEPQNAARSWKSEMPRNGL